MVDVLTAAGSLWQTLVRDTPPQALIEPRIISPRRKPFRCGNFIPVAPHLAVEDDPSADIVIFPELWLGPEQDMSGRYPELIDWIKRRYRKGATIYSACSGAIMLAETGLLKNRAATSHWAYQDLFHKPFPEIDFRPEPNLVFADASGRIVTAGHDLMAQPRHPHHCAALQPGRSRSHRQGLSPEVAWRGAGPLCQPDQGNPHAERSCGAAKNGSASIPTRRTPSPARNARRA